MTASEILGRFVAGLQCHEVPPFLVVKAKDHLLDTIGVACAGLTDPQARTVTSVVQHWAGVAEASGGNRSPSRAST